LIKKRFIEVHLWDCLVGIELFSALSGCGWGWKTQQWTIEMTASSGQLSHSVTAILTSECKDGQPACQIVNQ